MVPRRFRRIVAGQRGLTVAELTVVVAILGIVAATGVPSLWTYLRTATRFAQGPRRWPPF